MKKTFAVAVILLLVSLAFASPFEKDKGQSGRLLLGRVLDRSDNPLPNAVVYLTNTRTRAVKTYIVSQDGSYRFPALQQGTYTLRALLKGTGDASITVVILSNETRAIDLKLEPAFFDEPDFVVAGVSNAGNYGGHGSDTMMRSTEALTKAAASLGREAAVRSLPQSGKPATEESLRESIARAPTDASLHHALADVEEGRGNPLEAVREYQRAAELDASERNLFDWGVELLIHRAAVQAGEVLARGTRLFPHSTRMLLALAVACYEHGDYSQASRRFFEASDLDPHDPRPYLFLAKVKSPEITELDGYVERLGRFARIEPANAMANYNYAVCLWNLRKSPDDSQSTARVQALLEKAVRLDPSLGPAHLQIGVLHAEAKDFTHAIASFRKAIEVSPRLEEAHYRLAQAYQRTGRDLDARQEIEVYDRLSKESAEAAGRERSEIQQFVFELRRQGQ